MDVKTTSSGGMVVTVDGYRFTVSAGRPYFIIRENGRVLSDRCRTVNQVLGWIDQVAIDRAKKDSFVVN